jgi:hypothetical protein
MRRSIGIGMGPEGPCWAQLSGQRFRRVSGDRESLTGWVASGDGRAEEVVDARHNKRRGRQWGKNCGARQGVDYQRVDGAWCLDAVTLTGACVAAIVTTLRVVTVRLAGTVRYTGPARYAGAVGGADIVRRGGAIHGSDIARGGGTRGGGGVRGGCAVHWTISMHCCCLGGCWCSARRVPGPGRQGVRLGHAGQRPRCPNGL